MRTPTANITLKGRRLNALLPEIRNKETNEPSKWAKGSSRRHQSRWRGGKAAREKVSSSPRKCVSTPHGALCPHLSEWPFLFYLKISAPQEILGTSDLTWKTQPTLQMNSFYFPSESSTLFLPSSSVIFRDERGAFSAHKQCTLCDRAGPSVVGMGEGPGESAGRLGSSPVSLP